LHELEENRRPENNKKSHEEIYQMNSKIILRKELVEGLYRIEDLRKAYILF
jgi:tRNA (Thr-GGU) A37 N-methylase